jgi:cytochrome c
MRIIAPRFYTVYAVALLGAAHACDIAAAEPQRAALLFQTCTACHSVLGDGVGPDLSGIYGKKAASRPDFNYSSAMRASGLVWDEPTLDAFISNPQQLVKGTTMTFPGYPNAADVDAVVGYLKTLK